MCEAKTFNSLLFALLFQVLYTKLLILSLCYFMGSYLLFLIFFFSFHDFWCWLQSSPYFMDALGPFGIASFHGKCWHFWPEIYHFFQISIIELDRRRITNYLFTLISNVLFISLVVDTKFTVHRIINRCLVPFLFSFEQFLFSLNRFILTKQFIPFKIIDWDCFVHILQLKRIIWVYFLSFSYQIALPFRQDFGIGSFAFDQKFSLVFFILFFWRYVFEGSRVFNVWLLKIWKALIVFVERAFWGIIIPRI